MRNNFIKPYSNILAARICSLFWLILVLLQSVQVFSIVFKSEFTFARRVFVESTLPAGASLLAVGLVSDFSIIRSKNKCQNSSITTTLIPPVRWPTPRDFAVNGMVLSVRSPVGAEGWVPVSR